MSRLLLHIELAKPTALLFVYSLLMDEQFTGEEGSVMSLPPSSSRSFTGRGSEDDCIGLLSGSCNAP